MKKMGDDFVICCGKNRKAQVTIFIIIGIILVSIVSLFFIFREQIMGPVSGEVVPPEFESLHNSLLDCIEQTTTQGISILETQGGYIYPPEFEPGSRYSPFSSQFDFFGNPVPYWYYRSASNLEKEQVPTKEEMQRQLSRFVEENVLSCDLSSYREQGFIFSFGIPNATTKIFDSSVDVVVNLPMNVSLFDKQAFIRTHEVRTNSHLGALYNSAKKIYDYEQKNMFLENYAVDLLGLYAPVDGIEISCSPKIWNAQDVFTDLQNAIEANTAAIKLKSGEYSLKSKDEKYFVLDLNVDHSVNFLNSKSWPSTFEVNPSEGSLLISKPIGTQAGLGILGFCYVPYHYVYSMKYPVLIQVMKDDELFQFPFAVVIEGNKPRKSLDVSGTGIASPQLCSYENTPMRVNVYDSGFNPVEGLVSYSCLGQRCDIGETSGGFIEKNFPQCGNGFVLVSSPGFSDSKTMVSTIESGSVNVFLNRLYNESVDLSLDGRAFSGEALISFISEEESKSISYPTQKQVQLSEGQYEVQVQIFKDGSFIIPGTKSEKCTDVPQAGVLGMFGLTREKCFEIEVPDQTVTTLLAGGGKQNYYILESQLKDANVIKLNVRSLSVPNSLMELEKNYNLFEEMGVDISFE